MAQLDYESRLSLGPVDKLLPLITFSRCMTGAMVVGIIGNAINGWLSPNYFANVLGWASSTSMWQHRLSIIGQGVFESLFFGVIFGGVMAISGWFITRGRIPRAEITAIVFRLVVFVLGCWIVGGVVGVVFRVAEHRAYTAYVRDQWPMGIHWVGGSIWGEYVGGALVNLLGPWLLAKRWKAIRAEQGQLTR